MQPLGQMIGSWGSTSEVLSFHKKAKRKYSIWTRDARINKNLTHVHEGRGKAKVMVHLIMLSPNYQESTSGKGSEARGQGEGDTSSGQVFPKGWSPCPRPEEPWGDGGSRREAIVPLLFTKPCAWSSVLTTTAVGKSS